MKKLISFALILAIFLTLTACGCDHQWEYATCQAPKTCTLCGETEGSTLAHIPGELVAVAVDTTALTITHELPCSVCGTVMETKTSTTGIAPVDGRIHISPEEWYQCLLTVIQNYGLGQSLYGYPVESDDNALLHSIVTMSQMNAVFSFQDAEGNVITTDKSGDRNSIHNIRIDAQFTNDNAKEFFMLLMVVAIQNNSTLEADAANELASQIMSGSTVSDNGYTYSLSITSVEDHTVRVDITAE